VIDRFHNEYAFLSNFYPSPIYVEGLRYPSVEHAYQAAKTDDPLHREVIRSMPTAVSAKRFGRSGTITLIAGWDNKRMEVMTYLLGLKFSAPSLRVKLLATYPHELVERNVWKDVYWGIYNGKGENHLGKLLMTLRSSMQTEDNLNA